nr:hypothetical protein [Natrialba chahannaoensis]
MSTEKVVTSAIRTSVFVRISSVIGRKTIDSARSRSTVNAITPIQATGTTITAATAAASRVSPHGRERPSSPDLSPSVALSPDDIVCACPSRGGAVTASSVRNGSGPMSSL